MAFRRKEMMKKMIKEGGRERLGTPSEGATPKMHSRQQSRHGSRQRRPLRWPAHP
ncbi:hypothetical protein CCACVL1_21546, partial [Corchorus capsularis]